MGQHRYTAVVADVLSKTKTRNETYGKKVITHAAFIPLMTFLVYREVVVAAQVAEKLDSVFHADLHAVPVNLGTQKRDRRDNNETRTRRAGVADKGGYYPRRYTKPTNYQGHLLLVPCEMVGIRKSVHTLRSLVNVFLRIQRGPIA